MLIEGLLVVAHDLIAFHIVAARGGVGGDAWVGNETLGRILRSAIGDRRTEKSPVGKARYS